MSVDLPSMLDAVAKALSYLCCESFMYFELFLSKVCIIALISSKWLKTKEGSIVTTGKDILAENT